MIPYQPFAEHLKSIGILATPSELHAQACAFLCMDKDHSFEYWLKAISDDYCIEHNDDMNFKHVMSAVYDYAKDQLNKDDYSFQVLLPQEEFSLNQRIEILSDWITTFLSAMGGLGFQIKGLSHEVSEFIGDLEKIARVDNDIEGLEGEELDFFEITEYVRSGVMIMYQELNQSLKKSNNQLTH